MCEGNSMTILILKKLHKINALPVKIQEFYFVLFVSAG